MNCRGKPIKYRNHNESVREARSAMRKVAAYYADNARKAVASIVFADDPPRKATREDNMDVREMIYKVVWDDWRPGGLPSEFDSFIVRKEMEKLLKRSFGV